jgi:CyaY protein
MSAALTDAEYHRLTGRLLASIEAQVDLWLQDDVIDIDSARTGGLLELTFPDRSKLIINTQPPLHEVWLAARAGGFHYRWDGRQWVDTRDGTEFIDALSRHASLQGGRALRFAAAD